MGTSIPIAQNPQELVAYVHVLVAERQQLDVSVLVILILEALFKDALVGCVVPALVVVSQGMSVVNRHTNEKLVPDFSVSVYLGAARVSPCVSSLAIPV